MRVSCLRFAPAFAMCSPAHDCEDPGEQEEPEEGAHRGKIRWPQFCCDFRPNLALAPDARRDRGQRQDAERPVPSPEQAHPDVREPRRAGTQEGVLGREVRFAVGDVVEGRLYEVECDDRP